ncbi:MAG: FAD-dependent monooxygenase, partial [Xanthobacteraceae bacterium]|nr:FAD-dependent monooxygenase [Xanthobacteraceae bacterium]
AGIADAADLSWLIAGTLNGWASTGILDAYEAERRPITEQVSHFAMHIALKNIEQRQKTPIEIEWPGPTGEIARARVGKEAHDLNVGQFCCGGLNFGYFYNDSPIIAYDGEPHPSYTMREFTPSTVPGCRAPHLWLRDGRSLYDALGGDYTLLRFDPARPVTRLVEAAACRRVPLKTLDVDAPDGSMLYSHKLTLVRPDQHVAWRGNEEPAEPLDLIDLARGHMLKRVA